MKVRPDRDQLPRDRSFGTTINRPVTAYRPQDLGDIIQPFYKTGNWTEFPGDPFAIDGVQLIAYQFIPPGRTGFLKQVSACPYCPSALAAAAGGGWAVYGNANIARALDPVNGYWRTPAGWRSFAVPAGPDPIEGTRPRWQWSIRLVEGNIEDIRDGVNAGLSIGGVPLPRPLWLWGVAPYPTVRGIYYPSGLPGQGVSDWPPAQVQRFGDEPELLLVIPENTTLCLFAEWKQFLITPYVYDFETDQGYAPEGIQVYPLGPSFGSLIGYTQVNASRATRGAARGGW